MHFAVAPKLEVVHPYRTSVEVVVDSSVANPKTRTPQFSLAICKLWLRRIYPTQFCPHRTNHKIAFVTVQYRVQNHSSTSRKAEQNAGPIGMFVSDHIHGATSRVKGYG